MSGQSERLLLPEHSATSLDVVHHSDALAWLRGARLLVRDGSMPRYHAVLADPPYGLAFMGQKWDTMTPAQYQAWVTEWATLMLDVVYPGAVLVMFGGTRTYHRLACGLEDAGWEVQDCLMWMYGSGFPKSHDISKAIDREEGAVRRITGTARGHVSTEGGAFDDDNYVWRSEYERKDAPATPDAERWQGYGSALKPAYEPIILARAPRGARTYAALAREFGTGALAIDASRVGVAEDEPNKRRDTGGHAQAEEPIHVYGKGLYNSTRPATLTTGRWPANVILDEHAAAALDAQSGERPAGSAVSGHEPSYTGATGIYGRYERQAWQPYEDSGGASRFFYTAKAAAWEREAGLTERPQAQTRTTYDKSVRDMHGNDSGHPRRNVHPTVKPILLTEYLARLLLPPERDEPRRLLVPFAGVGSEIIGARLAGWDIITGIEQGAEYVALARLRIAWWAQFSSYEQARAAYQAERGKEARTEAERAAGVEQIALFEQEVA